MPFIWAFLGALFLCIAANVVSQAVDIGALLQNDAVFWILFIPLAIALAKMALGGVFLYERKQPTAQPPAVSQRKEDANTSYIKNVAAWSHHTVWYDSDDNKHWANTVIDMNGDEIVVHNSDGTGFLDK